MIKSFKVFSLYLMFLSALSFSQSKVIGSFTDVEDGEASEYIQGEFTEELAKAKLSDIKPGRFILRQRFEDPFDAEAVMYELFSGKPGPQAGSMNAFKVEGVPYKAVAKKKFYPSADSEYDDDIAVAFFDGDFIYVEEDAIYISQSGTMMALTPATNSLETSAPSVTPISADKTPMVEEKPEDEYSSDIQEASDEIAEDNSYNQYAADENMDAVYDRFGYGDDIQQYIGYGFLVGAGASLGYAVIKHLSVTEAQENVDEWEDYLTTAQVTQNVLYPDINDPLNNYLNTESGRQYEIQKNAAQKELDSRTTQRNLYAALGLVSGAIGGVLLTVDF